MKTNVKILKNGIRLVTIPMVDNPAVTVLVMVSTGSQYETKNVAGISHFLEHMVFKGTTKRPSPLIITTELDSVGSDYNAFTGSEYTGYYAKATPDKLELITDVIADMYVDPIFDPKELEKEKGVIIEELRMYRDLPQRHVHEVFGKLVYGDQPAGRPIIGFEETVQSMTREDFIKYRTEHYVAGATSIFVSGTFDESKIEGLISEKFAKILTGQKLNKEKVVEVQTEAGLAIEVRPSDQTHLVMGVRTYPATDQRVPTLKMLAGVLGAGLSSRLFQKLREEMGVCYYVNAHNDFSTDHGMFAIAAGVDKKRIAEVIQVLISELNRLKTEFVSPDELKKVRDYLAGTLQLGLETSEARAEFAAFQYLLKNSFQTPEEIKEALEKVTPQMIQDVAKDIFVTKHLNLAIVGNVTEPEKIKEILKF